MCNSAQLFLKACGRWDMAPKSNADPKKKFRSTAVDKGTLTWNNNGNYLNLEVKAPKPPKVRTDPVKRHLPVQSQEGKRDRDSCPAKIERTDSVKRRQTSKDTEEVSEAHYEAESLVSKAKSNDPIADARKGQNCWQEVLKIMIWHERSPPGKWEAERGLT